MSHNHSVKRHFNDFNEGNNEGNLINNIGRLHTTGRDDEFMVEKPKANGFCQNDHDQHNK